MARVSTFRVEHEETFDLLRWLDRTLIRVGTKFGEYQRDAPETFRMPAREPSDPRTHHARLRRTCHPSQSRMYSHLFSMPLTVNEPHERGKTTCVLHLSGKPHR